MTKFVKILEEFGDSPLFIGGKESLVRRYSDVLALSVDASFQSVGRSLVFCLIENDIDALTGYFALRAAGAVPMMLSSSIASAQLNALLVAYEPSYIWLPNARRVEFAHANLVRTYLGYSLLALPYKHHPVHPSVALMLGTSGSTGSPKFVRISETNLIANARSISTYLQLDSTERPITTLPPSYSYGLSILHSHFLVGASIAVTNKTFFDRDFWQFLKVVNATSFGGVPYHYEMLKKLRFAKMDLPSLQTLTQAGGRMAPELTKEFATYCANRGMRFFTMYGQSEATARMAYVPSEMAISKAGSIGIPIPEGWFWIEDVQGEVVDTTGMPGELVYQGPNVCLGYAQTYQDLSLGDENQGVLRTGDLAIKDADGYYYVVGRLKRFLKVFGNRINLQDVENFLQAAGVNAACAGKDDQLEIFVVDSDVDEAREIKKRVAEFLQVGLTGIGIYGVQAIPRNESGKVRYAELNSNSGELLA